MNIVHIMVQNISNFLASDFLKCYKLTIMIPKSFH